MNRQQRKLLREFFNNNDKMVDKRNYNSFRCNKCEFTTWAKTKLVAHKQEAHSY